VHYLTDPTTAPRLDALILPGSKSTVADLRWLRHVGWEDYLVRHLRAQGWVIGVCGGYQMLGHYILDPHGVESDTTETVGLGLLDVTTCFDTEKITAHVQGTEVATSLPIRGYEIHAGWVTRQQDARPFFRLSQRNTDTIDEIEGAQSCDGHILGTAIHGVFDNNQFRRGIINRIRTAKGLSMLETSVSVDTPVRRVREYDRFADVLEANADVARIAALVGCERIYARRASSVRSWEEARRR
jgi:adenosylcobyric acid synthase